MPHEELEPGRHAAGEFDEVVEVLESGLLEQLDEVGDIIDAGERADGDEVTFDAELFVGQVEDVVDACAGEAGEFEGGFPDGEGRTVGVEGEGHVA